MGQTAADELITVKDGTRHSGASFGTHLSQLIQTLAGFVLPRFEADLLGFQLGLEVGPYSVDFLQRVVLMQLFFQQGGAFLFTGTVHLFHIVHFPGHSLIFPGVGYLHHLVLALLDAAAVVIKFAGDALFLFLQMRKLFQHPLALRVRGGETVFEIFQFFRGLFEFHLHGMDGIVHALKGHELADLFEIKAHNSSPEI